MSTGLDPLKLLVPSVQHLTHYLAALERGYSPNSARGQAAADEEMAEIAADGAAFVDSLTYREGHAEPIQLPDGSFVPRLPGFRRWLWDGEFCGSISLRWQPGTEELPPYCLGHIGYTVVPWKRRKGYATRALALMLHEAKNEGLRFVEITTDPHNLASQRVIEANGGMLIERFQLLPAYGGTEGLRYRVSLT